VWVAPLEDGDDPANGDEHDDDYRRHVGHVRVEERAGDVKGLFGHLCKWRDT
jgi:hypothetical protein